MRCGIVARAIARGFGGGRDLGRSCVATEFDVLVIGGGVIGLAAARQLAARGRRVVVVERGVCGGESSWAGAGILSPGHPNRRDTLWQLTERSLERYPLWCAELHRESGVDPEYDVRGELSLCFDEESVRTEQATAHAADEAGRARGIAPGSWIEGEELRRLESAVSENALGARLCHRSATVRNPRLLRALTESCRRRGVKIREQTSVDGLMVDQGRVRGARVGEDSLLADHVVLAAGAWSSQLHPSLAKLLPVHPVRGQIVLLRSERPLVRHVISCGRHYVVPRRDGHILLGSTEEPEAGFAKRNTADGIAEVIAKALTMARGLADLPVEATWSGLRPGTPDERPYIGPVPGFDGLIAATGHFRSGLTLAPVTADLVEGIVEGRSDLPELSALRPARA